LPQRSSGSRCASRIARPVTLRASHSIECHAQIRPARRSDAAIPAGLVARRVRALRLLPRLARLAAQFALPPAPRSSLPSSPRRASPKLLR
jgi:hypothetical protein